MPDPIVLFVVASFLLGGIVKGVIGLGLPTVTMGLLAAVMPPAEAAAILIVPSLATNLWQMSGPRLGIIVRRLWPLMGGVVVGTLTGAGWLAGPGARYGGVLLGLTLALYALTGLASIRFVVRPDHEAWLGPLAGLATGLITAATGVFVIPAVPYLQAIGLEKDDLVQALGLSFAVSTVALAVNLTTASALDPSLAPTAAAALVAAVAGMWAGQSLRGNLAPATFRTLFFAGLLVLGVYLIVRFV